MNKDNNISEKAKQDLKNIVDELFYSDLAASTKNIEESSQRIHDLEKDLESTKNRINQARDIIVSSLGKQISDSEEELNKKLKKNESEIAKSYEKVQENSTYLNSITELLQKLSENIDSIALKIDENIRNEQEHHSSLREFISDKISQIEKKQSNKLIIVTSIYAIIIIILQIILIV